MAQSIDDVEPKDGRQATPERLTSKQRVFVQEVANGRSNQAAAEIAGYSSPRSSAHYLMRQSHIVEACQLRRQAAINGELAGTAVNTMRELMKPATPAATRFQVARWVLERSGHDDTTDSRAGEGKSLEDMSGDELAQAVTSGMQALHELAGQLEGHHIVDGEARRVETIDADSLDFLE